jgi:modification methylase nspV
MSGKREFGDYQTPVNFAEKVCLYLKSNYKINPTIVIEPTCGQGNFLKSSLLFNAEKYYGIEINLGYCQYCRDNIRDSRVKIINSNYFEYSYKEIFQNKSEVLVIGNPPWVTSSTLSTLSSNNLPTKFNIKNFKGLEAVTGASNFDICESIILHLINNHKNTNTLIAMLCKMSVARNIFKELNRKNINFCFCDIIEFDAKEIFNVNTSACILVLQLSEVLGCKAPTCNVYHIDSERKLKSRLYYLNGNICCDNKTQSAFDGKSCLEWRQGIKHDCSKVMELIQQNNILLNLEKEIVDIEDDMVFPLIKSSMFKMPVINKFSKYVIVTQKRVREETKSIKNYYPRTWDYLYRHIDLFERRKSSIYKGAPLFSMFGVGDYSYSQFKVGISGFYKSPLFSILYSDDKKPVMLDDTCYFISFENYNLAYVAMLLLNSNAVQTFLKNIAFLDSKRPYTKKVLERINFSKIVSELTYFDLKNTEKSLQLSHYITEKDYETFKQMIAEKQNDLLI